MPRWLLPVIAGCFGGGILLAGEPALSPGRAGAAMAAGLLLAAGVSVARARASRVAARPNAILEAAGLWPARAPPDPRERILTAAGIPVAARQGGGLVGPSAVAVRWSSASIVAVIAAAALLGGAWASIRTSARPGLGPLEGRHVLLRGVATGDARTSEFGWSVEARVDEALLGDRWIESGVKLWLNGSGPPAKVEAGQPLEAAGTVRPLDDDGGFAAYLRSRGVAGTASVSHVSVLGPPRNPAMRLANAVRSALRRGSSLALPPREAGLFLGLSIGDTSRMEREVEEDFRATGLGHLLAVSGGNVAMFLLPVLGLALLLRASAATRLAIGLAAVFFFALVTRWEPSVLRASAMATVALVGVFAGRPRATSTLLGAAVLALLVVDPGLARSLGFQLSVAATAGLAAVASPIAARLRALPRPLALALAATLAAQVGVTPILLLSFGVVPTVTILANVLAAPAVAPALLLATIASGVSLAWLGAGRALGEIATPPLSDLAGLADTLARAPLPSLTGTGVVPVVLAGGAALVLAWRLRRGRRRVGAVLLAVALGAWAASSLVPQARPSNDLRITFLDVGQGDAAVLRSPDGATVLIDAGPDEQQVATELARLGVRRIDLAVATHAHADHTEGFPAILSRFHVGLLIEPGCHHDSPSYERFVDGIEDEEVRVRYPRGGDGFEVGAIGIEVLGPDACWPNHDEPNNDSLVLRVSYEGRAVLFTGDAEEPAQQDLMQDGDPIEADVLKVPHHGGDTSLDEFFAAVDADVAVVSSGPNDYGHPVPSVLDALATTGATVLRTDVEGDITVIVGAEGVLVESATT